MEEVDPSREDQGHDLVIDEEEDVLDLGLDLENGDRGRGKDQGLDLKGLALEIGGGGPKRGVEVDQDLGPAAKAGLENPGLGPSIGIENLTNIRMKSLMTEKRNTKMMIFLKMIL